jgi:hypothetical protein
MNRQGGKQNQQSVNEIERALAAGHDAKAGATAAKPAKAKKASAGKGGKKKQRGH